MKKLVLLSLLVLATAVNAQQKIDVTVKQVNDRRSAGFFAQLNINLEMPKIQSADVAAARVFVSSATDETGRDLLDPERGEPAFETNLHTMRNMPAMPATVSLTLKNPERKAMKVKEVRGEIELYMPGKDPNSVAEIAKFVTQAGKPLSHKALKANGVEITFLTDAQVAAEKKKRADAKKKEYAEMGFSGEDLENMLKSFMEMLLGGQEDQMLARVKDPNNRIHEITYLDAAGETKLVTMQDDEGIVRLSTWGGKPQNDWKLRVSMKTSKNITRYSFALNDVPLP